MYLRISHLLVMSGLVFTGCQISDEDLIASSNNMDTMSSEESSEESAEESAEEITGEASEEVTEEATEEATEEVTEEVTEETIEETIEEINEEINEDPETIVEEDPEITEEPEIIEEPEAIEDPEVTDIGNRLRITVMWDTPSDPNQLDDEGTDMDLHLLHPEATRWSQSPWDCYFANPQPDWGVSGHEHDPSLDIDDVNGTGPESISYHNPEPTTDRPYQVGVHYYSAGGLFAADYGPSTVTVSVYIDEVLVESASREVVQGQFFVPFEIMWSEDGVGTVSSVDRLYEDLESAEVITEEP